MTTGIPLRLGYHLYHTEHSALRRSYRVDDFAHPGLLPACYAHDDTEQLEHFEHRPSLNFRLDAQPPPR